MFKEEKFSLEQEIDVVDTGIEDEFFLSQFKVAARKYFPKNSELQTESALILKAGNKFFDLIKNTPIDEYFIRLELAPFFWMYESPIMKFIKNFYRLGHRVKTNSNSLISFIEYYEKWVKAATLEDKKYFAGAAVNIMEHRNFSKNFYLQILHASIKIFDKTYSDPISASEILNQTFENISHMNMEANTKNELCYYINIYNGFSQLMQNAPDKAAFYFSGALVHKENGINAKFYLALTDIRQGNFESAVKQVVDIYDTDIDRLKYALTQNNDVLFNILCDLNIIQNIFAFNDFAHMVVDINQEINNRIGQAEIIYNFLKNKIIDYNHFDHAIPKEPSQSHSILTLDRIIHRFAHSTNLAFLSALPLLEEKFLGTINEILSKIEEQFESQIQKKCDSFTLLINESLHAIEQLNHDMDLVKSNVKSKVERMLSATKESIDQTVAAYEEKLKYLENIPGLNPLATLKNGMSYNIFISVIVLLVVGFASYSNSNYIKEISSFSSMISAVILTGTKWGLITFIIGIFFSAIQAGSTVMERNYRKQALVRKIQSINDQRESELARIKMEGEELEKKMIEKLKEKIGFNETRIEKLKEEKEKEAEVLRKKYKEELTESTKDIRKLLKNGE